MELIQQALFQGRLSDSPLGLSAANTFLLGIANFLCLLVIVRKLPLNRQFQLVSLGLVLGAGLRFICIGSGLARLEIEPVDSFLGALLIFLAFSSSPGFKQSAMPSFRKLDLWISVAWLVVVDFAFTRLSSTASMAFSGSRHDALIASAIGYSGAVMIAIWLFSYAGRIRGLIRASSWLSGICGFRMLLEGLGERSPLNFNSVNSVAMWVFWTFFLAALLSTFIRRSKRSVLFPPSYSGSANFLVRK